MKRALWTAWALAAVLVWADRAQAGETFVTKVRGLTLTLDKGADDGLEVGLEVTVVRPPGEAIIHPLTGENLGAPEIQIASGRITKVSPRAASVQLDATAIIGVRPGDVARFLTVEEKMVMDQETATVASEQAAKERTEIRTEASRLGKGISSLSGTIKGLESAIRDLRRFDNDVVKPQFTAINRQMGELKQELAQLRETVTLMNVVPVHDIGEGEVKEMTPEELERLRVLIQEELAKLQSQLQAAAPPPPALVEEPPPPPLPPDIPEGDQLGSLMALLGENPFYKEVWFFALLGAVGLAGIAFWLYTRMSAGGEDDEEDEEEDEGEDEEEEDEDVEVDVEEEEADDIVVEETS